MGSPLQSNLFFMTLKLSIQQIPRVAPTMTFGYIRVPRIVGINGEIISHLADKSMEKVNVSMIKRDQLDDLLDECLDRYTHSPMMAHANKQASKALIHFMETEFLPRFKDYIVTYNG
ncbi:MAG: hypothetical protein IEMM0008_1812 [bacterium]|nr:MAG: hypothetical protein IEMM0008_1812 [bacterium]